MSARARAGEALVLLAAVASAASATACRPEFDERVSRVSTTRVLAVRSEPPEARPGDVVTHTLLVASPSGPVAAPLASFAYCAAPKPLTENGAVSSACLGAAGVRPLGDGASSVTAALPSDACFLFGPEVSSAELRPRDPDATGGFYQPLRVVVTGADVPALGFTRVACKQASISAEVASELTKAYVANRNPRLLPLERESAEGRAEVALDSIPRGARVVLRASWPEGDAERYVAVDVAAGRVVPRREAMRVSWAATAGTFDEDRTGRDEEDLAPFTENAWTAPATPGDAHLFAVLRDSRGGVAFVAARVVVR